MKKFIKGLAIVFVFGMILAMVPAVDSYAATKKLKSKVTYKLKKGVLTIKGKGKMPKKMTFKKNKKIKKVVIKKGVTSIPYKAFYKCKNLKKVKIANTVKQIGAFSFSETKIKKITIPKSVKVIGEEALAWCEKLTEVTMPGDFELKFAANALYSEITVGSTKLKKVNFNTNYNIEIAGYCGGTRWNVRKKDPKYKSINGVIYTKDGKEIVRVPAYREVLKVASGCETFCLQSIFYETQFYDDSGLNIACGGLRKIVLPKSIKKIENKKHSGLFKVEGVVYMNLQEVIIKSENLDAESVVTLVNRLKQIYTFDFKKYVDVYTFRNTDKIVALFPNRIKKNGDFCVLDEKFLLSYEGDNKDITIPEGIETIGSAVFQGKKCEKVVLPEGLKEIGDKAFLKCEKLEHINFPESLKKIGGEAFSYTNIKKIEIPKNITEWGRSVFSFSSVQEAVLPNEMTVIPAGLFDYCRNLTKVNVPSSLQKIEEYAFEYTKVDIQSFLDCNSLTEVGICAFMGVTWTEITIPAHIEVLGSAAFRADVIGKATIEGDTTRFPQNIFL